MDIVELKRELIAAQTDYQVGIQEFQQQPLAPPINTLNSIISLLNEISINTQGALEQCQQLHQLHSQLQNIKSTLQALNRLTRAEVKGVSFMDYTVITCRCSLGLS